MRFRLLPLPLMLFLAACAPFDQSLVITAIVPPDGACTYTPNATVTVLQGILDVSVAPAARTGYFVAARVENNVLGRPSDGTASAPMADFSPVNMTNAIVELVNAQDTAIVPEYSVPATGRLTGSDGMTPGTGIAGATIIPPDGITALAGLVSSGSSPVDVEARVTFRGVTDGGFDVESPPYRYLIRVCFGCLQQGCPPAGGESSFACAAPCVIGQDAPFPTCAAECGADGVVPVIP
jgi:hypothetical protein